MHFIDICKIISSYSFYIFYIVLAVSFFSPSLKGYRLIYFLAWSYAVKFIFLLTKPFLNQLLISMNNGAGKITFSPIIILLNVLIAIAIYFYILKSKNILIKEIDVPSVDNRVYFILLFLISFHHILQILPLLTLTPRHGTDLNIYTSIRIALANFLPIIFLTIYYFTGHRLTPIPSTETHVTILDFTKFLSIFASAAYLFLFIIPLFIRLPFIDLPDGASFPINLIRGYFMHYGIWGMWSIVVIYETVRVQSLISHCRLALNEKIT